MKDNRSPSAAEIAEKLTDAQRQAMLSPRWIHPGGMDPICLVDFTDVWPEGVAQFFTMTVDRLTPLGQQVRAILSEPSS